MALSKLSAEDIRKHKGVSFPGIATIFFCYDGNMRLFLAKRSKLARDEHGRWEPGAGGLKHGQTLIQNVRRELKEEYGADPLRIDFIGYWDSFRALKDGTPTHWLLMSFAVKVDPTQLQINEPDMVDDSGWFSLDALPSPLHSQFGTFLQLHGGTLKQIMTTATLR